MRHHEYCDDPHLRIVCKKIKTYRDNVEENAVKGPVSADLAVESIRRSTPVRIISDIMIPVTDGVTFTRMIREKRHKNSRY